MHSRTQVIDLFSTFLRFAEDRFESWIADGHLVRSMQQRLAKNPDKKDELAQQEAFWVLYWHQRWQQEAQSTAARHLWAYLQEPCYWAAENVAQRFVNVQCTVADGFQIAIADVERILKRYRPDHGSSLKVYARTAFGNAIRDQLRQRNEVNISSDWGLLRRLSQSQLKRSLLAAGFIEVASPILVWQCFKAICIPDPQQSARGLPAPSEEQLTQMVERYNQLRYQLSPVPPSIDVPTLQATLKQSVQAARAYLTPKPTSLNQPQDDDASRELIDSLAIVEDDHPMARLLAAEAYAEQQQYQQQIRAVLEAAIATLDGPDQTLLELYYGQTLTQKAIATQLQIKQYQVSRQLSRVRQKLLASIAKWSQETLHIAVDSTVLASINEVIHEWLQHYYRPK